MTFLGLIISFIICLQAMAGESSIPLQKGVRMASDDLGDLTSRQADDKSKNEGVDLSLLEPKDNYLWVGSSKQLLWSSMPKALDDQQSIELANNDEVNFQGSLESNSGLYRFNVKADGSSKIYTVHLDKTLHTLLIRKNLLRKLGYVIPAIKYIKELSIRFATVEQRDEFLNKKIPENTLGASDRWVISSNNLTVNLRDVAVSEPSETDFDNVAMGVPTQTINSRTLRSLVIPYSVADLYESVNLFNWVAGKIDNHAVVLSHFTGNNFSTTIEDAQWMLRRVNALSRDDFKEIVDQAFFPNGISPLIVEKLLARRNSLNRLFSEKVSEEKIDQNITVGTTVKKGKVLEKNFPDYASRFDHGDAESPFAQLQYYLYAKIQSNVIDNGVALLNKMIADNVFKSFDLSTKRASFFQKQFKDGLDYFVKTGEIKPIGISQWSTPTAGAQLILSRDIVLGNYLGTDNLVQLADTIGASAELGFHLGVEGLGNNLAGSLAANVSVVRTFTHLKPVKNLKQSLKEPYKNMVVNLLKHSLKEKYFSLSELKNSKAVNEEKAKSVQELLKEVNLVLDTGESLIMTDRLMPSVNVKLNYTTALIGAGVGVGGSITTINRIQIYKKSPKILQIYDDHGFVRDINMSIQFSEYINILKVSGKLDTGNYHLKSYMVNLSSDLEENPNLYTNALGIYHVLKNKNFEVLQTTTTPVELNASFKDRSASLSLLFLKLKAVHGKTFYDLKAKDGVNGKYFSLNKDSMSGINVESFSKQVANYYISQAMKGNKTLGGTALTEEGDASPGDSFFGRSRTKNVRFEASIGDDQKFDRKFLTISDTKQGWAMSEKRLKRLMGKVNDKFETTFFDISQIDFTKLRMFRVGYHLNLYDRGIERLNNLEDSTIDKIEAKYKIEKGCNPDDKEEYNSASCGDLGAIRWDLRSCRKSNNDEEKAQCDVTLIQDLMEYLKFSDLKQLIGESNLYVYGTIDGFRKDSEVLNDTIYSNTIGKIGSKQWNGPIDVVRELLGLSSGEFTGSWMRDSI